MSENRVLVVGAGGKFAGLVVPELARRGAVVRGLVRDAARGEAVRKAGAAEIALGDLRDGASIAAALRDVTGVFHIGPAFQPDEAALGVAMVDAAKAAGVQRFVLSSAMHPTIASLSNHAAKPPVEDALYASGMQYTVLQPAVFYQNLKAAWPAVIKTGVFAEPFSRTRKLGRVDYRDVAELAADALTDDRLAYGTFELCAGNTDRDEVASSMTEILGRPITAAAPGFEEWAAMAHLPPEAAERAFLTKMYAYYDEHGFLGSGLTLRALLGRAPRSLEAFFRELGTD